MAGFYNSYQQSVGQKPANSTNDDELLPGFGQPGTLAPPAKPATAPKPTTSGSASPASQIQKTGNTGMTTPGGSNPTPQTTTGTPSSATGSGLPSYGGNWNFNWQTQGNSSPIGAPPSSTANYNPTGEAPSWGMFDPNNGTGADPIMEALNGILSGDASGMDTSAMKNRLKEQRLIMEGDQRTSSRQAAAGRGMLDSGWQAADERRIGSAARKDILGGFRDIDIEAANAGVRNKIAASAALDSALTGQTSRADVGFKNSLAGSEFLEDQAQFGFNAGQEKDQFNLDSWGAGADATIKTRDQDIQVAQGKTNELIARLGLSVNLEEIANSSSRDKMQFLTDIFNTLVKQEQFNAQMGLNYNQLGMNMNEILANVAKSIGA